MQLVVKNPASAAGGTAPEWIIIELQGDLESRSQESFAGKQIGSLVFTKEGTPIMIIGHHILYGKIAELEKPFAVIRKAARDSHSGSQEEPSAPVNGSDKDLIMPSAPVCYDVQAIVKKKIIFKTRPKPIIANVPKKL